MLEACNTLVVVPVAVSVDAVAAIRDAATRLVSATEAVRHG